MKVRIAQSIKRQNSEMLGIKHTFSFLIVFYEVIEI